MVGTTGGVKDEFRELRRASSGRRSGIPREDIYGLATIRQGGAVSTNRRIAPVEIIGYLVTPTLRRGSSNLISAERGLMLF